MNEEVELYHRKKKIWGVKRLYQKRHLMIT